MSTEKSITDKTVPDLKEAARFEFISGPRKDATVAIDRQTFFIGRSKNNNLILTDRTVSRKHAVVNFLDGNFVLSDLDSYWGVCINGERIRELPLKTGDVIKFGDVTVRFRSGTAPMPAGDKGLRRSVRTKIFLAVLALAVILAVYLLSGKKDKLQDESAREIEFNYQQGVRAYNVDKNIDAARMYWEKVLQLDPQKKTSQSSKSRILLDNLDSNAGEPQDR